LFSTFFTLISFSQEWQFIGVQKDKKNKYVYEFRVKEIPNINVVHFVSSKLEKSVKIRVFNTKQEHIEFARIRILCLEDQTEQLIHTGIEGYVELDLKPGSYSVFVNSVIFMPVRYDFQIVENESVDLVFELHEKKHYPIYQIHSRKKLRPSQLKKIIECVARNDHDFLCCFDKRRRYFISMSI